MKGSVGNTQSPKYKVSCYLLFVFLLLFLPVLFHLLSLLELLAFLSLIRKEQASKRQQNNVTKYMQQDKTKTIITKLDKKSQQKSKSYPRGSTKARDPLVHTIGSLIKALNREMQYIGPGHSAHNAEPPCVCCFGLYEVMSFSELFYKTLFSWCLSSLLSPSHLYLLFHGISRALG